MIYILLFILLFAGELAYFRVADHFNIIDKPNERSSHSSITLRGGGIIFYLGMLMYFAVSGFNYPWFFAGLSFITAISFADDIKAQSPRLRLLIHIIAMFFMFYQLGLFSLPWYFLLIALVLCTGILNAYNFMDGINGITGGYSLVVAVALWYINSHVFAFVDNQFIFILMLSLLVFNFFNFRKKAKCFAGDVGSISMAFIVVFLLGKLIIKSEDFTYIILLALYGVDTILTIIHRLILKENIFEAHRKHLFQLMANEMKMPHLLVSGIYMLLQALIIVGYLVVTSKIVYFVIVILLLILVYLMLKSKYFHLHKM